MSREEREVLRAAVAWWRTKRPRSYTRADHIGNATVNVATDAEKLLAEAVAMFEEAKHV